MKYPPQMRQEINTFFGQVVVINLISRTDRRAEMSEQLQRIGLHFGAPALHLYTASKPAVAAGFSSLGAHGCFMSHLAVLRHARDQGASSLLILEDDLNLCADFKVKFDTLAQTLAQHDWGMWYGCYDLDTALTPASAPLTQVDSLRPIGTSAFLAINGHHIAALVAYLEAMLQRPSGDPLGGPMHIDGAYCWFRRAHPEVSTWLAHPALGRQRSSRTDVHALRWFEQWPWSARLTALLRRWRNRLRT